MASKLEGPFPRSGAEWAYLHKQQEEEYKPFINDKVSDIACYALIGLGVCLLISPLAMKYGPGMINSIANGVTLGHTHVNLALNIAATPAASILAGTLPAAGILTMAVGGLHWAGVFNDRARLEYELKKLDREEKEKEAEEKAEREEQEKYDKEVKDSLAAKKAAAAAAAAKAQPAP